MIHELKTESQFFTDAVEGRKTFEVRVNDRPFAVGDFLALNEVEVPEDIKYVYEDEIKSIPGCGEPEYTGRCALFAVSYILTDPRFIKDGYCILGVRPCQITRKFSPAYRGDTWDREGR